ncbi:MAG: hypothetical protein GF401_04260 [Chitinivibrionales bacterium]|nr:hypothetical protein [Chitinivibrionales bacterium]
MDPVMPSNFLAIRSLIESYQKRFPVVSRYETVVTLINGYNASDLYERIEKRNKERTRMVRSIVEIYSHSDLFEEAGRYDLFRRLRLQLREDDISNISADMLNPRKSPLGKSVLVHLLKKTEKNEIAEIINGTNANLIEVKREQVGDRSRIDLRVHTKNLSGENSAVGFEFKVGHGSETFIDGEWQTVREWDDLMRFADERGIRRGNVVGFFITPNGIKSKSRDFQALSSQDFNEIICEVLNRYDGIEDKIDFDGIGALRHFFKSRWLF